MPKDSRSSDKPTATVDRPIGRFDWERWLARLPRSMLSGPDVAIGRTLASYANADGSGIRPSEYTVANDSHFGLTTVKASWARLREHGLLTRGDDGEQLSITPALERSAVAEDARRADARVARQSAHAARMRRVRAAARRSHVQSPGDFVQPPGDLGPDQDQTHRPDLSTHDEKNTHRGRRKDAPADKSINEEDREITALARRMAEEDPMRADELLDQYFGGLAPDEESLALAMLAEGRHPKAVIHTIRARRREVEEDPTDESEHPSAPDPYSVACPRCDQPAGRRCQTPNGSVMVTAHRARVVLVDPSYDSWARRRRGAA